MTQSIAPDAFDYQSVDREQWLHMYEQMYKIRQFEENANELYLSRKMPGLTHLYIGEEAVAADPHVDITHRRQPQPLAHSAYITNRVQLEDFFRSHRPDHFGLVDPQLWQT